jgi:hypothetical protein
MFPYELNFIRKNTCVSVQTFREDGCSKQYTLLTIISSPYDRSQGILQSITVLLLLHPRQVETSPRPFLPSHVAHFPLLQ